MQPHRLFIRRFDIVQSLKHQLRFNPNYKVVQRPANLLQLSSLDKPIFNVCASLPHIVITAYFFYPHKVHLSHIPAEKHINFPTTKETFNRFKYIWNSIIKVSFLFIYRVIVLISVFTPIIVTSPIMFFGKKVKSKSDLTEGRLWWYRFITSQIQKAGPSFVKLSQMAASRTDLFSEEFCSILGKLHSENAPHSFHYTKSIIEESYGLSIDQIFSEFDSKPLGVGAIAQVYRAKFKESFLDDFFAIDDEDRKDLKEFPSVAIKILHPNVSMSIECDLSILRFLANTLNKIPSFEWLSFPEEINQFSSMMKSQLNLRQEGYNLKTFHSNFLERSDSAIVFPTPYLSLSTDSILIESFEHGIPIKHFLNNKGTIFDRTISNIGLEAFLHMLIHDNFVHADMHPGNLLIKFEKSNFKNDSSFYLEEKSYHQLLTSVEDSHAFRSQLQDICRAGYEPRLVILDTGIVSSLGTANRINFLDLFQAISHFDGYQTGQLMIERCRTPEYVREPEVFALKMQHLVLQIKRQTFKLSKVSIADILGQVLKMVRAHHVKLEGEFISIIISILILEGVGRQLNPDLDLLQVSLPFLRSYALEERGSKTLEGMKQLPYGGWWLKLWIWIEAREWIDNLYRNREQYEEFLFKDMLFPLV